MTGQKVSFSKREWDILSHRLNVPDAIADALEDEFNRNIVEERVRSISKENHLEIEVNDFLDIAILQECLEGCTFFADIDDAVAVGEISNADKRNYFKAAYSLERKLGAECTVF